MLAFSYALDHYIPTSSVNKNNVCTKFKVFFQKMSTDLPNVPETQLQQIKPKLRKTCEHYCNIKVPYKYSSVTVSRKC